MKPSRSVFILLGFISIISQIILMRRLMVIFSGNELSVGVVLTSWMLWTGVGSILFGRLTEGISRAYLVLSLTLMGVIILFPLTLLLTFALKPILGIPLSQIVGLPTIIVSTAAVLGPLCILLGFCFVLCCRLFPEDRSVNVGRVYLWEALGSALGGISFNWAAIPLLSPFQSILILDLIISITIWWLLREGGKLRGIKPTRRLVMWLPPVLAGASLALLILPQPLLDLVAQKIRWQGFHPIYTTDSRYGSITLTRTGGEYTLFYNGFPSFTYPDPMHSEEVVHLAMLEHPRPREVLLVGGGLNGVVDELLKYPLTRLDYVQLDPKITEVEMEEIPHTQEVLRDRRLKTFNLDGRYFINQQPPGSYDLVIINLSGPDTAQLNRFYTLEFFEEVRRILKEGGTLATSAGEPANYISDAQARFLTCIYGTLRRSLKEVVILPLSRNYLIASERKGYLTSDYQQILNRLHSRKIKTRFFRDYYLRYNLSPERVSYTRKRVESELNRGFTLNLNFKPIAYLYNILHWETHFNLGRARFLKWLDRIRFYHCLTALLLLILPVLLWLRLRPRREATGVISAIGAMGFAGISTEIVILLSFQIIYGYMFYQLGLIVTAFMVGLSFGAILGRRSLESRVNSFRVFLISLIYLALYPLLLWAALSLPLNKLAEISATLVFMILTLVGAVACGVIFQLGADIFIQKGEGIGFSAGWINGADHLGAALGALFTSAILIPIFGLINTLIFSSMLVFLSLLILLMGREKSR
jgi:spermidine synthase